MVYQWKSASRIKADANDAGAMCEQLEKTVGLTPANLLDANRDENAPLHNEFEWNDAVAAEEYRLSQAGYIIRMLCVRQEEKPGAEPVRAFFRVDNDTKSYDSISVILQNEDKHKMLLRTAYAELEAFRRKYEQLSELELLFDCINDCINNLAEIGDKSA